MMIKIFPIFGLWLGSILLMCLYIGTASAQSIGFADDFSVDSTRYSGGSFDDSTQDFSIDYLPGELRLEATGTVDAVGSAYLSINDTSDMIEVDMVIDSATTEAGGAMFLDAVFYNDSGTGASEFNEGDVIIQLNAGTGPGGSSFANYCMARNSAQGERTPLGDQGSEFCNGFGDITIVPDQTYTVGLSIDRAARTITASFDGVERTINLTTPVFPALSSSRRIQSWVCCEVASTSVVRLQAVRTTNFTDDLTSGDPGVFRYREFFDASGTMRTSTVNAGQLQLQAQATADDDRSMRLITREPSNYIETRFAISSATELGTEGRARFYIENRVFNDTSDGGNGVDDTGMVDAQIEAEVGADGRARIEYCLVRRNGDAESDGLLADGNRCGSIPIRIELDTFYRVSIALDKDASTITYVLDDFKHIQPITTPIFDSRNEVVIGVAPRELANAVVLIDDLRTSPAALTVQESGAGLSVPLPFPDPVDPSERDVDGTISAPYDFEKTLSFVDDFSDAESRAIGFWGGARDGRGDSGIRFVDGAIELQANSAADNDDGNYSEIYINGRSDLLRAEVSLRSESTLPPDPRAEAEIVLRAVFHNDIQDFGTDIEREGDVQVRVYLRQEGDGRMRAAVGVNRRDETGNSMSYNIIDGSDFGSFEGFIPAVDTVYELALTIDREQGVMIASIDERTLEIPLPTEAFQASAASTNIQVSHRGTSGKAVGRIHSIKTDTFERDFANGPGLIGPYSPAFNTRFPGREVTVADGRARLLVDATLFSGRDTRIWGAGGSDFTGATVTLSSESSIATDGSVQVGLLASLYNDVEISGSGEGRVSGQIWLTAEAGGIHYAEYCAFRSNDNDFSSSVELITGRDDDCARFDLPIVIDQAYPISLQFSRETSMIIFTLGSETREYAITTSIFDIERPFNAVVMRASDGSIGVGYVDDLAYSANPTALASSDQGLGNQSGTSQGGSSGSSGGSGGCSIAGSSAGNGSLILLVLVAMGGLLRRRPRRSLSKR